MADCPPKSKQDEQCPLLKVDGEDIVPRIQQMPITDNTSWAVVCTPKESWFKRWPEFVSTCWMTLIILGISFLVFYALGMAAYRHQQVILIKCNNSKPESNVFYHYIVHRGSNIPFILFSDYLTDMATQFPSLRFNIIFLIDDSFHNIIRSPRHRRGINTLIPYLPYNRLSSKMDETNKRALSDFQKKYHNVNVTIMLLSKYMFLTPLKFKWRMIPLAYLTFYARVFSVWQHGGIGMDLLIYNNYFTNDQRVDRRVSVILRQHNDGIIPEDYTNSINKINCDEENILLFTFFDDLVYQMLNILRSLLNSTILFRKDISETRNNDSLKTKQRNKHAVLEELSRNNVNISNTEHYNITKVHLNDVFENDNNHTTSKTLPVTSLNSNVTNFNGKNQSELVDKNWNTSDDNNLIKIPHIFFNDISIFYSDSLGPSYVLSDATDKNTHQAKPEKQSTGGIKVPHLLSIDKDGIFVASSLHLHPFLGHMISADSQQISPKSAIQNTLLIQCSNSPKDDFYCNNIFLL